MDQLIAVTVGALSGMIWEKLSTSSYGEYPTFIPSLIVKQFGSTIHLHHWLIYVFILILIEIWAYRTNRIFHPAVLMIVSFIIAAVIYNFYRFPDWYKFIK